MQNFSEILKKCPLFYGTEDNIEALMGCLNPKHAKYSRKETVFSEGTQLTQIGIVLSGSVQLERVDFNGNRSILTIVESGELFGESFACSEKFTLNADIVASSDCEILFIDCKKIICTCCNSCAFHNQMIHNLLKIVATKNIILNQKSEITSKRSTREKLLTYLNQQSKKTKSKAFTIPYDRQALADFLEVDRSGLSTEIGKLIKEGVLKSTKNKFELL